MQGDKALDEHMARAAKWSPRERMGRLGPFQAFDLVVPFVLAWKLELPLPLVVLGQTAVHYKLGIESAFTRWLLPPFLFPRNS